MACSSIQQRVSIAGTVTNRVTGEVIPGSRVRITNAPAPFAAELMALVEQAVVSRPQLQTSYDHLFQNRPITADTLKTAQIILDALERSQQFCGHRPDETQTGGDGHYCFFDLPPGNYGVSAAVSMLDRRYGMSHRSVQVKAAVNALVFAQLDIDIFLMTTQTLPAMQCPALVALQ